MYKKTNLFLIFLTVLCQSALSQNGLMVYKLYYLDFMINNTIESDTSLCESDIKKDLDDGEYFIYYDNDLTKLWMNGVIIDNKLEGKWEFRNRGNKIFTYQMFSDGKKIRMNLPENTFAKIYLPNKVYEFRAYYISASNDTLTSSMVTLNTDSQIYEIRHNVRFRGTWIFHYEQYDSLLLGSIYPWNDWENNTLCLITENESEIQIYPPRRNQFAFTEIIKFPSVSPLNLKTGHKWQNQIQLPEGYRLKEWENTTFYHQSEVIGKRVFSFKDHNLECWIIKGSSSNQDFGTSYFEYLFNEVYGFVRMEWINYDKQKAVFELINFKILK